MNDEPGLSPAVRDALQLYAEERSSGIPKCELDKTLPLPPEIPIEPGTVVAMTMERHTDEGQNPFHVENPWRGSGQSVIGVVAGINYGGDKRNHWYYHVVWQSERWSLERPDGKTVTMQFSSERGTVGWPHLWRHDLLIAMRDLPQVPGLSPKMPW